MKWTILLIICLGVLLTCTSCIFDNKDDSTKEHYLMGTVKNASGIDITDASIYIVFDPIWDKEPHQNRDNSKEVISFTTSLTDEANILLNWTVRDESNVIGYRILCSETNDLQSARAICPDIAATHEPREHSYSIEDYSFGDHIYYYWLQSNCQEGQIYYYGPSIIEVTDPQNPIPMFPLSNTVPVYPNPFSTVCWIYYYGYHAKDVFVNITNAYTGSSRSYNNDNIHSYWYPLGWDGTDNNDIDLCNGVYQVESIAKDSLNRTVFHKTVNILKNNSTLLNNPVTYSSISGYKIPFNKYFQFGKKINIYDPQGNALATGTIKGNFTVYIKKNGYLTASRHIMLSNLKADYQSDFILQASK